jgi:ubiquinone/menaquinone biosynthesis C-methylase UbiE
MPNTAQIAEWNGEQGQRWVEQQRTLDTMIGPFGAAALRAAAPQPGERVIDVGCGCGSSSLALADAVGPGGRVLGIDVSQPMLEVARAAGAGQPMLSFVEADAAAAALPSGQDLLFSRFGLMFFDDPAPALRHLRTTLRAGGRCAFVCWRTPRDNPWAMVPLLAARQALGVTPAPADPLAPGPFAFADDARLRGLLEQAGFSRIRIERCDLPIATGSTAREAAERSMMVGPASRLAREAGPANAPRIAEAMELALAALAASDGSISLAGSTWVVMASNGN